MHCTFSDFNNVFQIRFDELSNLKGKKGDCIINTKTIYLLDINDGELSQERYIQTIKLKKNKCVTAIIHFKYCQCKSILHQSKYPMKISKCVIDF